MNFKGESFDFLAFSEEPGVAYNHKYKKKLCTYVRTDISSHQAVNKTDKTCEHKENCAIIVIISIKIHWNCTKKKDIT